MGGEGSHARAAVLRGRTMSVHLQEQADPIRWPETHFLFIAWRGFQRGCPPQRAPLRVGDPGSAARPACAPGAELITEILVPVS